jgi:hypothetical protein
MPRKTRRGIERALDDLDDGETDSSVDWMIVHKDPDTGEWYADAELTEGPLDKDRTDPVIVLQETVVETGWSDE